MCDEFQIIHDSIVDMMYKLEDLVLREIHLMVDEAN